MGIAYDNFLFFTGYMKKVSERKNGKDIFLTMRIPNMEIAGIYADRSVFYKAVLEGAIIFEVKIRKKFNEMEYVSARRVVLRGGWSRKNDGKGESTMEKVITETLLEEYREYLYEEEKSRATIRKYLCDLHKLMDFAGSRELTKKLMIEYKEYLRNDKEYKTSSINSFLVAANRFFEYKGWYELRVKTYKVQNETFIPEERDLTKDEYKKLVQTAKKLGRVRMFLLIQTICATGIRISELEAITVAAVKKGTITIYNKGKERTILLPDKLRTSLLYYIYQSHIKSGAVFQTANGKPLDRTYIWRSMKSLCEHAGVEKDKVFPHNLRHLFAKSFYQLEKDIAKLADILGHSSMETTRIYIRTSSVEQQKQMESMDLLVDL